MNARIEQTDERSGFVAFLRQVPRALVYPFSSFRPVALLVLCFCWPAFGLAWIFTLLLTPGPGPGALVALWCLAVFSPLFLLCVPARYLMHLVERSAEGDDRIPGWPRIDTIDGDLLYPIVRVTLAYFVALGPLVFYNSMGGQSKWIAQGLWGVAALYFPAAVMTVSILQRTAAALPHVVIPTIVRTAPASLLLSAALWPMSKAHLFVLNALVHTITIPKPIPASWWIISCLFVMALFDYYLCAVGARLLGAMCRAYREKLGW